MTWQQITSHPLVTAIMATWPGAVITMKEPNEIEIQGMMEAAAVGGEYLDSIGQSDLATLTEDQYMTFVERIVRTYEERCMYLYCNGDPEHNPPF
jgi:hypothetical protein